MPARAVSHFVKSTSLFHRALTSAASVSAIPDIELSRLLQNAPQPSQDLHLDHLLSFARKPIEEHHILGSASHLLHDVPKRLAARVRSLEALPFIVCSNPYISSTLTAYRNSFGWLATYPKLENITQNDTFVEELEDLVRVHANDIPTMAKGFQECSRYMSPGQITEFLDCAISTRISVRFVCEHHIALSRAFQQPDRRPFHVGAIDTQCSPRNMIEACSKFVGEICEATLGASPHTIIDGDVDATFSYVPVHLEYIITEILKNAYRATVENHYRSRSPSSPIPPVVVTICPTPQFTDPKSTFITIRVRDEGGGISTANMEKIFSYAFTTAGRSSEDDHGGGGPYAAQHIGGVAAVDSGGATGMFGEIVSKGLQTGIGSTLSGLGYGLPMSRLYASYFGGSLHLMPLEGWGTDVFIKVRSLKEAEHISS